MEGGKKKKTGVEKKNKTTWLICRGRNWVRHSREETQRWGGVWHPESLVTGWPSSEDGMFHRKYAAYSRRTENKAVSPHLFAPNVFSPFILLPMFVACSSFSLLNLPFLNPLWASQFNLPINPFQMIFPCWCGKFTRKWVTLPRRIVFLLLLFFIASVVALTHSIRWGIKQLRWWLEIWVTPFKSPSRYEPLIRQLVALAC